MFATSFKSLEKKEKIQILSIISSEKLEELNKVFEETNQHVIRQIAHREHASSRKE